MNHKFKARDKVVNKYSGRLPTLWTISSVISDGIRFEGQPYDHVFVPDGFRPATEEEIKANIRLSSIEEKRS